jgi:hypothetical protein
VRRVGIEVVQLAALSSRSSKPAPQTQANVYIYRKSVIHASAAGFHVSQDGKEVAKLFNTSCLALHASPGAHKFGIDEGGFTSTRFFDVTPQAAAG